MCSTYGHHVQDAPPHPHPHPKPFSRSTVEQQNTPHQDSHNGVSAQTRGTASTGVFCTVALACRIRPPSPPLPLWTSRTIPMPLERTIIPRPVLISHQKMQHCKQHAAPSLFSTGVLLPSRLLRGSGGTLIVTRGPLHAVHATRFWRNCSWCKRASTQCKGGGGGVFVARRRVFHEANPQQVQVISSVATPRGIRQKDIHTKHESTGQVAPPPLKRASISDLLTPLGQRGKPLH